MFPISLGRLATRGGDSRVDPRPSVSISGVSTSDSARTLVSCDSRVGAVLSGSVTRLPTGNDTETKVSVALWRAPSSTNGDFIDRFVVEIEPSGAEAGQASFTFDVPVEYSNPTTPGFWITLKNASSADEDYLVHFDVASLVV